MNLIRSEIVRLFAVGFVAGTLMVGAATATDWNQDFAPQAFAAEQQADASSSQ